MRTTINIEDAALQSIRKYADERRISLGQAASDLVQRGADNLPKFKMKNGWAIIETPRRAKPLTNKMLDAAENTDYAEEHKRAFSPRR